MEVVSNGMEMEISITHNERFSIPEEHEFSFTYDVLFTNRNWFPVIIMAKGLVITDAYGNKRKTTAPVYPTGHVLYPGHSAVFQNAVIFRTEIGKIDGGFIAVNAENKEEFTIEIPTLHFKTNSIHN